MHISETYKAQIQHYNGLEINFVEHLFKGTVSRDFRPSVFFIKQSPLGP
jgi:hypothetical protein